jgi:sodium/pantothenate symporter
VAWVNREGALFNDVFSIYVAGFVVGASVVCRPHILTKALYVKTDQAVKRYLWIFTAVFVLFLLLGTVGFFARLTLAPEQLVDPGTGAFRQDLVMTVYLQEALPPWVFTVISIVLLAAAMSTLDGVLVGVSTITANDLVLNLVERFGKDRLSERDRQRIALRASHGVLVLLALVTFVICLDPPRLLGIFGQVGVYGMVAAAVPPLLIGILFQRVSLAVAWIASVVCMTLHFGLYFLGARFFPAAPFTFANPGVTLSLAVLLTVIPAVLVSWAIAGRAPRPAPGSQADEAVTLAGSSAAKDAWK